MQTAIPNPVASPVIMNPAETAHKIAVALATELNVRLHQVVATIELLNEGATVPFIARYRKEATGGLDDTQLRNLAERLDYLRELEERRATILHSIAEQQKLTPELEREIQTADTKQRLEDLYLPYKPKRRTRAQIAREAGLEPLALSLWQDPTQDPQILAANYLNPTANIQDNKAALDGARDILAELFAEDAALLGKLRSYLWNSGWVRAQVVEGKQEEGEKFRDYFEFAETIKTIPSHRALALFRGRNLGVLNCKLDLEETLAVQVPHPCVGMIAEQMKIAARARLADKFLLDCCTWAWRVKIHPALETELLTQLREAAENEAIKVFGRNLKDLLLAAPAGPKAVLGLDPGIRTGVKLAVVDHTGKLLETGVIYPHEPRNDWEGSQMKLAALIAKHQVALVAIGNGTASRETDKLVGELLKRFPAMQVQKIVVSEAGASVYSASEQAAKEFPELDVSLRGAVSIARRLQDPLAELVKIDPKSIGVGQYQHDVNQRELARQLDAIVEDCVNAVGVDVNTASVSLLARVSGLNSILAKNIVDYRDQHGAFASRAALKSVPRLGEKTFEQAAGFLRVNDGSNPLDCSAVHPEAYPLVERILAKLQKDIRTVMGQSNLIRALAPDEFMDEKFGLPTVKDILNELEKPGRDPRPEFKTAQFKEGVEALKDLSVGMILEGVVTNVANFGAFVDIGVHQDGLVHISALASKFVKDAHEVVKAGDLVKVKVLEVDLKRQRIALTMRLDDVPQARVAKPGKLSSDANQLARAGAAAKAGGGGRSPAMTSQSAMAVAFAKLKK